MDRAKDTYFMHCCFSADENNIKQIIDDFGYGYDYALIGAYGLRPIERRGYHITWWPLPESEQNLGDEDLYSNIEFKSSSEGEIYTEIKISCTINPYLFGYLTQLAVVLWTSLEIADKELLMAHPSSEPVFKSHKDYLKELASASNALKLLDSLDQVKAEADQTVKKSSKRGPITYSDDRKLAALEKWRDYPDHDKTLQEWLVDEFGVDELYQPNVLEPRFSGWRRKSKKSGQFTP